MGLNELELRLKVQHLHEELLVGGHDLWGRQFVALRQDGRGGSSDKRLPNVGGQVPVFFFIPQANWGEVELIPSVF